MMKRSLLLLFLVLVLTRLPLRAQPSYADILASFKDPRTPATSVDALLPQLIAMEKKVILAPDSQQMVLEIFLHASYAYARNFHFKQGLMSYRGYLGLKDKFAAQDKAQAVHALLAKNQERRTNLDEEIVKRKNETVQLSSDTQHWEKMNGKFSRNYSLVVILVTAVLALLLIRINMNASKARTTLDGNRRHMLDIQRIAVFGRFYAGALTLLKSSTIELTQKSAALTDYTRQQHATSGDLAARIADLMKKVSQVQSKMNESIGS